MEHVYEVRQLATFSWAAACTTHGRAAVAHTEGGAEKALIKKCKQTERVAEAGFNVRQVDTRSEQRKIYDAYQAGGEGND
jgi:hypothetical protein